MRFPNGIKFLSDYVRLGHNPDTEYLLTDVVVVVVVIVYADAQPRLEVGHIWR